MIFGLNFTFLSKYWFYYMDGLKVTLQLAFWTLILSSIVGVIMGMIRVQNYKIISTIIDWWINFIRGVPIMVQIFIVYYGIATSLPQFWAAVVSLTVNSSVYIAEHTRAGMQAVNKGQMEAARWRRPDVSECPNCRQTVTSSFHRQLKMYSLPCVMNLSFLLKIRLLYPLLHFMS